MVVDCASTNNVNLLGETLRLVGTLSRVVELTRIAFADVFQRVLVTGGHDLIFSVFGLGVAGSSVFGEVAVILVLRILVPFAILLAENGSVARFRDRRRGGIKTSKGCKEGLYVSSRALWPLILDDSRDIKCSH